MSRPLEHNYIGLSEAPSMEISGKLVSSKSSILSIDDVKRTGLKTDLSLGLPGSETPERKPGCVGVTLFGRELERNNQNGLSIGSSKACSSGAKRGFSDALDSSEKWVLSINGRSGTNMNKDSVMYSPREVVVPSSPQPIQEKKPPMSAPASKAQVVGWPPIRCFRKNTLTSNSAKNNSDTDEKPVSACLYVKVSMDGAPYLRKVDIQTYRNYVDLSSALEKMFGCFITGKYGSYGHANHNGMDKSHSTDHLHNSEYVLTYEDKDGDWMLVGDVPWKMFTENCRKLRIMKGSEAIGLTPKCS